MDKASKNLKTKKLTNPYIQLSEEYKDWLVPAQKAFIWKGRWREYFTAKPESPSRKKALLHLEIGPGNGLFFAKQCLNQPKECFLFIELRYKSLVQTIRRARKNNSINGAGIHCQAQRLGDLFKKEELNNVYIHFPNPWLKKKRHKKHQLLQPDFCQSLFERQKAGSFLELKTDSLDYFQASLERLKQVGYQLKKHSLDLHQSSQNREIEKNFMESLSWFELLFFKKKIPVLYALLAKV